MGNNTGTENMRAGARILRTLMKILLGAAVAVFLCAIAFLILQILGKNSLYSRADSGEMLQALSEMTVKLGGDSGGGIEENEEWMDGDIRYQGIHYRYNEDVLTFLFMGIDKMTEVQKAEDGYDGGQSDALFLLVLDPHRKKISVIGIPRDTMTEIQVYGREGEYIGTAPGQVTLQHGYGDGAELSCERSVKAVSHLFYNLPIHGYCAINMGAIPLINDAVGGIELQALETLDFKNFHVKEGETVHLKGMNAYYYLHNRDTGSFNSAGRRLGRQKQYLTAYADAAIGAMKKDITFPVTLYSTLSKYMVTDISVDEVSYLATQVMGYSFDGEGMHSLAGVTVMGEKFEEFYVDEKSLYELILKVFYEEVE
ncbi:MAG: LytR family transcriptional regulator [Lachnospiraceae bacterium]|nr:LytR family transcriptional regulator [Lachnospiraceae bacterium]